jgi:multicomponent Na+:H+ antiporter subunit C
MTLLTKLLNNYPYVAAVILFFLGAVTILTKSNLFKKLIGISILQSGIFLIFIAAGNIRGGIAPLLSESPIHEGLPYINPLPSALILTGIVVSVSVTAFALALVVRLYKIYGTTDAVKISEMISEMSNNDSYTG